MLQRNGRRHRQTLKALTDPQPEFVSLVFGGANKTPFRAMRADGTVVEEAEVQEQSLKTHAIAKVEFSGEKFADEKAVKEWLVSGGYDPKTPIIRTDDGFLVDSTSGLDKETVLSVIDMVDAQGLKIWTVGLKSDDTLELTVKEMHPGASLLDLTMEMYDAVRQSVVKGDGSAKDAVDAFMARFGDLITKLPEPGAENYDAMVEAVAPEIEVEKVEEAQKYGARNNHKDSKMIQQMHDHSVALGASCDGDMDSSKKEMDMSTENTEKTEEVTEAVKADETEVEKGAAKPPKGGTDPKNLPESDRKPHGQQDTNDAGEGEAVDTVVHDDPNRLKDPEDAADGGSDESMEGDNGDKKKKKEDETNSGEAEEVTADPDPVAALTKLVTELTTTVKSMQESVSNEIKVVVERVAAVEETRQTRKGADVDETNASGESKPTVSEGIADLRAKAMLGMRKR